MNIITIDSTSDKEKLIDFCREASTDKSMPANVNMDIEDWQSKPHTLLYTLFIQKRFDIQNRGAYFLLEKDGIDIAGSGCYPLATDPNICIIAVRGYTVKKHRSRLVQGKHLLPVQVDFAKQQGFKTMILTVNEYNIWFKDGIEKLSNGLSFLGTKVPKVYEGWKSFEFPVTIQYTKQWCLYKNIDETYYNNFYNSMELIKAED